MCASVCPRFNQPIGSAIYKSWKLVDMANKQILFAHAAHGLRRQNACLFSRAEFGVSRLKACYAKSDRIVSL